MGYCRQISLPSQEPVSLAQAKAFMSLPSSITVWDSTISILITSAREYGEILTCRALAQRNFVTVLDSFPYYTDTVQSQLAYPPSYYSLPRYSTTLWNYSQMIKLGYTPVLEVTSMQYIGTDGAAHQLSQDIDFTLDNTTEPSRIFPTVGTYWPANLYVASAASITYLAGYDPNPAATYTHTVAGSPPNQQPSSTIVTGVPQMIILAILNLVAFWFANRGAAVPANIDQIFLNQAVYDFAPTRG